MSSSGPHQAAPLVLAPLLALGIVSFALAQSRAYFPIGIDRLLVDQHTYVEVTGSVLVVTQTDDGTTTFRIRDSRNRSLSCIIPKGSAIQQPKVGALVKVERAGQEFRRLREILRNHPDDGLERHRLVVRYPRAGILGS